MPSKVTVTCDFSTCIVIVLTPVLSFICCEKVASPSKVTGFTFASFETYGTAVMVTLLSVPMTVPMDMPS